MVPVPRLAFALLVAVAGCGDRNETGRLADPARDPVAATRAWPTDAPPRVACVTAADCTVAVTAPVADPCCETTVTAMPVNARWLAFMATWRGSHCAAVTCPALALPGAQLAPCGYEPRCIDRTCANACGEMPAPTPRSALPPDGPKRLACREDSDCVIVGNAPSIANACCDGSAIPTSISRDHLQFVAMWRGLGCKETRCPPPDTATFELAECAREPRCVKRSCTDACGAGAVPR
jgi:hypothetical protein